MSNPKMVSIERRRLVLLSIVIFFLFSLLVAQFYRIQVVEGEKWSAVADRQHFFIIKEPFRRGTFISNGSIKKGHPDSSQQLVVDVQKYHLHIDPRSLPPVHRKPIAAFLSKKLELTVSEQSVLRKQFGKKSRSRRLATWLDTETRDLIAEWWEGYARQNQLPRNALFFINDYQRSYPFGKLLGQVLHTIQDRKDETTEQAIPTGGLELFFNRTLQGKQGKRRLMRSPRNALETGEVIMAPQHGADLHLTINHCLQAIAEEEISRGVRKSKAKAGWAVMMDPFTGEVLALAQYPFFYPPDYQTFFNQPELVEHTRVKAVVDAHEPGSVMKPCTMAIALMANEELVKRGEPPLFSPQEKMATSKGNFKGRSKPLTDTHLHYYLNMEMALQKSSNIYLARLVEGIIERLGKEWYRDRLKLVFGFGEKSGIELPAESSGLLPALGKKHQNGTLEWSGATPYSLAMGHNIQVNSLQLLRAYSVFVNGGYLVKPTLIRKIVRRNQENVEEVLKNQTEEQKFPKVLSKEIGDQIIRALKFSTKLGGTAVKANIWGYTEAGKSGTANKVVTGGYSANRFCSSFIGVTPLTNPAFILVVSMDEPEYGYIPGVGKNHHGGTCSAPVFRAIATRALEYLGIPPDDPHGYPQGDPRYDPMKADWVMETRRLQEIYESWNKGVCNNKLSD